MSVIIAGALGVIAGYAFRGILGRYFKWATAELKNKVSITVK